MKNAIYEYLKDKSVLILGFGREGKSTYNLIRSIDKDKVLGIADLNKITDDNILNDKNVIITEGEKYLDACNDYDIIIKGPGVIIKDYLDDSVKSRITCQTDLFMKYATFKTIGITGTKGKSTTTSLMYHILKELGQETVIMGNIGIPVFDTLDELSDNTIAVIELGCHQLEYMRHSPNIGVILDIYEEHLDHYVSMDAYVESKKNIYKYQKESDYILLGKSNYLDYDNIKSKLLKNDELANNCFYLNDNLNIIFNNEQVKIPSSEIVTRLEGKHNLYNILVCLTIIKILGLDIDKSLQAISTFKPLPHRMEFVGNYDGISYYDDSIATSVESVIQAIDTLKKVDTVIVGGMDRGLDYSELVRYLENSDVRNILLLPDTSIRINEMFRDTKKNVVMVNNMEEAVNVAKKETEKGKICLLSPAAASYNVYKNFEVRGDHFKSLVSNSKN